MTISLQKPKNPRVETNNCFFSINVYKRLYLNVCHNYDNATIYGLSKYLFINLTVRTKQITKDEQCRQPTVLY